MLNFINLDSIPTLPKRENNIDKFSTYLMLNNKNGRLLLQWKYQPSLKRNIDLYAKKNELFTSLCQEQDKGMSLLRFWQTVALKEFQPIADWEPANKRQLAWEHLASYFEDRCYWAAKNICQQQQQKNWEEYLCLARLMIYDPLKLGEILLRYDAKQSNIDTYITEALEKNIKYEAEVKRFSRWRLLCKKSEKELKEALQVSGCSEPELSQIIFAKKYFKQVYLLNKVQNPARKTGKKWPDPDREDFEQTAQCYNAEKILPSAPHEVSAIATNITAKQIQVWMENCIAALQNYPKSIVPQFSLDALQTTGHEAKSEISNDGLELEWQGSPAVEESGEKQQFLAKTTNSALHQRLEDMKPEFKKILLLYYGFGLTQQQLATKLEINQSTISRYLRKSTITLLETLAGISQPQQWVEQYVSRWLKRSYTAPLHSDLIQAALVSAIKKFTVEEKELLQLYYGQQLNENQIANQLKVTHNEVVESLARARYKLQDNLLKEINTWIKDYLEKWLSSYYLSLVDSLEKTLSKSKNLKLETAAKIDAVVEAYIQNCQKIEKR